MSVTQAERCVLCAASLAAREPGFFDCSGCALLQRARADFPSLETERAFYRTHENDVADPGYRRFLSRVSVPLIARLPRGARGLDYGSGPAPALVALLRAGGLEAVAYDPWSAPERSLLDDQYDFITCTEVVEHFHDPRAEFQRLFSMLRPGGTLAVMTEPYREQAPLSSWRYARDPTHVVFYREQTFRFIAQTFGTQWEILGQGRVVLFTAT